MTMDGYIMIASLVLLICILFSNLSYKVGVPTLLIFLVIGMVIGSDKVGLLYFHNAKIAQMIGSVALAFILFTGGMDTKWSSIKTVIRPGGALATIGVALTAILIGYFAYKVTDLTLLESMLLGSIVSSTDAATVFSILKSKNLNLKERLVPTLELESGSNDPMAYMMTLAILTAISGEGLSNSELALFLVRQMLIGGVLGYFFGKVISYFLNHIKLKYNGLYYGALVAWVYLVFSLVSLLGGNGFLALYIAGIVLGNKRYFYKRNLIKFFDGQTWIMQIFLFVVLGVFSTPESISQVLDEGLQISIFMIFIARPIAIVVITSFFGYTSAEKVLISWAGFRGAASIVFALMPFIYGLDKAEEIFNIVFFIVLVSVLVQGSLFPTLARKLDLVEASEEKNMLIKSFNDYSDDIGGVFAKVAVLDSSDMIGTQIVDIEFPEGLLIISINRDHHYVTPNGSTVIEKGDILLVTAENEKSVEYFEDEFDVNLLMPMEN
ncbi:MAG: potassium/proton antiporter [Andreesenia angusta]|nr:potassium/proton antiporter [Andreesenia angusta]